MLEGEILMEPKTESGQRWQHVKNQRSYDVLFIANEENTHDDDNNPPIVVYQDIATKKVYARKLSAWRNAFVRIDDKQETTAA